MNMRFSFYMSELFLSDVSAALEILQRLADQE